jgi:hypothetical protein
MTCENYYSFLQHFVVALPLLVELLTLPLRVFFHREFINPVKADEPYDVVDVGAAVCLQVHQPPLLTLNSGVVFANSGVVFGVVEAGLVKR